MELILLRDVFALSCLFSLVAPLGQRASDINEIIRDHTEPDPAFHSIITFVPAAIETVAPLGDADASLGSGPPFLTLAEPAFLLLAFAFCAFGGAIGNANAFDALHFGRLVLSNDFGRWLEQAEDLTFGAGVTTEDARAGLLHDLLDAPYHYVDFLT